VFEVSREGRAAEIAAWSNAATALAVAGAVASVAWSRVHVHALTIGLACGLVAFVALRFALAHRVTVWVAAVAGTLTISALGGSAAWLFAHVVDSALAPSIAAVAGALGAALAPAWGYAQLARRRAEHIRDSLIDPPVSGPTSR
jgi:hypothetical protein